MKRLNKTERFIIAGVLIVLIVMVCIVFSLRKQAQEINSFDECAKAGNPILESYPSVCMTKDGKRFTNPNEHITLPT